MQYIFSTFFRIFPDFLRLYTSVLYFQTAFRGMFHFPPLKVQIRKVPDPPMDLKFRIFVTNHSLGFQGAYDPCAVPGQPCQLVFKAWVSVSSI
jgi:hypothetical protein